MVRHRRGPVHTGVHMKKTMSALAAATLLVSATIAQAPPGVATVTPITLPSGTLIQVTTADEITSMKMKEGDKHAMIVAADVSERGSVIIPRGAPVMTTVTWRTGKGIGGKSAKFEISFDTVTVHGQQYALKGKYRAEGRGNTAAALLGSMIITGRSATITAGQVVNAFTSDPIPAA
jgi:hypothetical protein